MISALYAPQRHVQRLVLADKFADLCPEPPVFKPDSVIHSKVLRLVSLPNGQLKSFGDYGIFNIQSKVFDDDQYTKNNYWWKVSWKNVEDVYCEEEVRIQEDKYLAFVERHPDGADTICFNSEQGKRHIVALPEYSVQYMCLMGPAELVFAFTQCKGDDLANMVFYKIGFIKHDPVPVLKNGHVTTDFISLAAMCSMTHGPEPLLILCGLRLDAAFTGSAWISAFKTSGQVLWRYNGSAASIEKQPLSPRAVCTDGRGNLFVGVQGCVLLFDANGNFKKLLQRNLGQEANISLAYREAKDQLVVSHVCKASDAAHVKGAKPVYNPLTVLNFYNVHYSQYFDSYER